MKLVINNKFQCYWKDCEQKVEYEWLPSKNPDLLWVCQNHYNMLIQVYDVKILEKYGELTIVQVIPDLDVGPPPDFKEV